MSIAHQEIFDQLYEKFQKTVSKVECDAEHFIDFLVKAMETVEQHARELKDKIVLHGLEKKELVEDIMKKFYENLKDFGEDMKEDFEKVKITLSKFMDKTIDVLISSAKGQYNFAIEELNKCGCITTKTQHGQKTLVPKDVSDVGLLTDRVHDEVEKIIKNKKFDASNFIILVTIVMQIVEQSQDLTGPEKKALAIRVIKKLVNEIPMAEDQKEMVDVIVQTSLDKTIDYIIMAANGDLDLGKLVDQCENAFSCCYKQ